MSVFNPGAFFQRSDIALGKFIVIQAHGLLAAAFGNFVDSADNPVSPAKVQAPSTNAFHCSTFFSPLMGVYLFLYWG